MVNEPYKLIVAKAPFFLGEVEIYHAQRVTLSADVEGILDVRSVPLWVILVLVGRCHLPELLSPDYESDAGVSGFAHDRQLFL